MQIFCQSTIRHVAHINGISLAVGTASQGIGLHGEFFAPVCHIGVEHAIAVGTARECHLAIGLHVCAVIDVYHSFCATHSLCHRGVAADLDTVYLTSLHVG